VSRKIRRNGTDTEVKRGGGGGFAWETTLFEREKNEERGGPGEGESKWEKKESSGGGQASHWRRVGGKGGKLG